MKYIREKLAVSEYFYPYSKQANPVFEKYIMGLDRHSVELRPSSYHNLIQADITKYQFYNDIECKEVKQLITWISSLISRDFIEGIALKDRFTIKCSEIWGVVYDKGNQIIGHNHLPSLYNFVYYVNAPKGSSPIRFTTSGYESKAETGKLIIFNSSLYHCVPPNKCKGRIILTGNFISAKDTGVWGI